MKYNIGKIHFLLYPSLNLVTHTSNLLGLSLGGRGSQYYHLRKNAEALNAIREAKECIDYPAFYSIIKTLVYQRLENVDDALEILKKKYLKEGINLLRNVWNNFYKNYWENNKVRIEDTFQKMINNTNWNEIVKQMEDCTDSLFEQDVYVVANEATALSAMMIYPDIIIGTPFEGSDCGFVHEGIHILMKNAHNKYSESINFMLSHKWSNPNKLPYNNWQEKIEQAIVITLDSLITKRQEYLEACHVGDLKEPIYDELVKWYEEGAKEKLHKVLLNLLKEKEQLIFKE